MARSCAGLAAFTMITGLMAAIQSSFGFSFWRSWLLDMGIMAFFLLAMAALIYAVDGEIK